MSFSHGIYAISHNTRVVYMYHQWHSKWLPYTPSSEPRKGYMGSYTPSSCGFWFAENVGHGIIVYSLLSARACSSSFYVCSMLCRAHSCLSESGGFISWHVMNCPVMKCHDVMINDMSCQTTRHAKCHEMSRNIKCLHLSSIVTMLPDESFATIQMASNVMKCFYMVI